MTWPHVIWHITRAAPLSQHVITRLAGLRVITRQPLERTQACMRTVAEMRAFLQAGGDVNLRVPRTASATATGARSWVRSNVHRLWRQHVITWREVAEDTTRVIT